MAFRFANWMWAFAAALGLLGAAAFIIFVIHPGGFEGQIGWLIALMPGAIVGLPLADRVFKVAPRAERVALWSSVLGITFIWYFAISYAAVKAYRLFARASKR